MDTLTFKYNLEEISSATIKFARQLTWNDFSDNIYFVIRPNAHDDSDHLDNDERINLGQRKDELNKFLTVDEVIERLWLSEKVPVWIDVSVYKATKRKTIIELMTSRRFRKDEYMHKNTGFPPFHIAIPTPPYQKNNEKFDINWKHNKPRLAESSNSKR
jgi:hypothetical protein